MSLLVAALGASVSFFCGPGEHPARALAVHRMTVAASAHMPVAYARELARNVVAVLVVDPSESPVTTARDAIRHRLTVDRKGIVRIPAMSDADVERCAQAMARAWAETTDGRDGAL